MQLINNHKFHILLLVIKEKQKKEPIMNVKMTLLSLFLLNLFFFILAFSIRWVWSFTKICKAVKMCYILTLSGSLSTNGYFLKPFNLFFITISLEKISWIYGVHYWQNHYLSIKTITIKRGKLSNTLLGIKLHHMALKMKVKSKNLRKWYQIKKWIISGFKRLKSTWKNYCQASNYIPKRQPCTRFYAGDFWLKRWIYQQSHVAITSCNP